MSASATVATEGDLGGTRSAGGSEVLDPGTHEISHNCGGAEVDAAMEWTLTLGG